MEGTMESTDSKHDIVCLALVFAMQRGTRRKAQREDRSTQLVVEVHQKHVPLEHTEQLAMRCGRALHSHPPHYVCQRGCSAGRHC
jgi:hypothetical protein